MRTTRKPIIYVDGHRGYLELHAMRAPVGGYTIPDDNFTYEMMVQDAIRDFETTNNIDIYQLGRSGRHICIEDTPANRRRYSSLQRKAIIAAHDLWAGMREDSKTVNR